MGFKSPLRALPQIRAGREAAMGALPSTYIDKVLGYGPIAYWPLNETAGVTAIDQVNSPAQDGTYTGVTLGQTVTDANGVSFVCPLFDGTNDYVNVFSATLAGVFNGSEGSLMLWERVLNAGVWTDGSTNVAVDIRRDNDNIIYILKRSSNDTFWTYYKAGGTQEIDQETPISVTTWMNHVITWSSAADEFKTFRNGSQLGTTSTGLGAWGGAVTAAVIGALNTTPTNPWEGWLANCAIWDTILTQPQIIDLAEV